MAWRSGAARLGIDRWAALSAAIGALGAVLVLLRTAAYGPGAGWDSSRYVSAARNLAAGNGFAEAGGEAYTGLAPLFPLLLAFIGLFGPDPLDAAAYVNAAAFGLTVFATALWARRRTGSPLLAAWAGCACALTVPLAGISSAAMTEAPFVLFAVLSLYALDRHLEGGARSFLLASAAAAALACAMRYLGLALVAGALPLVLLADRRGVRPSPRGLANAALFAAVALPPIGAWMLRNLALTGSSPTGSFVETGWYAVHAWHGAAGDLAAWAYGKHAFAFLGGASGALLGVPLGGEPTAAAAAVLTLALLAPAGAALAFLLRRGGPAVRGLRTPLAFAAVYATATVFLNWRLDFDLPARYLAPLYPPLLVSAAIALGELLRRASRRGRLLRLPPRLGGAAASLPALALAAVLALWLAQQASANYDDIREWRAEGWGAGFRNGFWAESATARHLRDHPPGGPVWSTIPAALVVAAELRTPQRLIDSRLPVVARRMEEARADGVEARIVWFHWGYKPRFGLEQLAALPGLELEALFEDGAVLRVAADPAARAPSPAAVLLEGARPLVRSHFGVYLDEARNRLVYVREECGEADPGAPFFLGVYPVDPASLSGGDAERGFGDLGFRFNRHGFRDGGRCVAARDLPDYGVAGVRTGQWVPEAGELWSVRAPVLGNAAAAASVDVEALRARAEPLAGEPFEVYLSDDRLFYVRDGCTAAAAAPRFFLHVFPADRAELPWGQLESGFANLDFWFDEAGALEGGRCVAVRRLPGYAVAEVRTGQWAPGAGRLWEARAAVGDAAAALAVGALDVEALRGRARLLGGAAFEVHLDGRLLVYVREACAAADIEAKFFLHVVPRDPSDLPEDRRGNGFANLDFWFGQAGALDDGRCLAVRGLPAYPIASIRTGQWVRGEGELWSTEAAFGE